MFEFIKNLFRREKTKMLRMIDIDGNVTKKEKNAVIVVLDDATTFDQWYRLNLKKVKERRAKWVLPAYELMIETHKGKKVANKEEFAKLINYNIERSENCDERLYDLNIQVLDKIIETSEGDVETILRTHENFLYNVDWRAAYNYRNPRNWNWIEIGEWWDLLAIEACEYLGIKEEQTAEK